MRCAWRLRPVLIIWCWCCLVLAGPARAAPLVPGAAELEEAKQALKRGDAQAAIPLLEQAYLLRPGPRALELLADALLSQRRYGYAAEVLDRLRLLTPHGPERQAIEERLPALRRSARLRVASEPPGAEVVLERRSCCPPAATAPDGRLDACVLAPPCGGQKPASVVAVGAAPIRLVRGGFATAFNMIGALEDGKGVPTGPPGRTPFYTELLPGRWRILLRAPGFLEQAHPIELAPAEDRLLQITLVIAGCDLRLTSDPPGAMARIDDGEPAATPVTVRVRPGPHQVQMDLRGRVPLRTQIACEKDETLVLTGALPAVPVERVQEPPLRTPALVPLPPPPVKAGRRKAAFHPTRRLVLWSVLSVAGGLVLGGAATAAVLLWPAGQSGVQFPAVTVR
jgi:hypothetical protein